MKKIGFLLGMAIMAIATARAQFSPNNIVVLEAASSSANNTTGTIVELAKTGTAQTPVATYPINGTTGTNALRFSGSATSTMYLANSNDRSLICFSGGNTTTTTGNMNTFLTRGVGTFGPAGTYSMATTYTGSNGNQARSATTINNTDYFIADQGGLYTNMTTTPSPTGNFRAVKTFGGVVYIAASSSVATTIAVSTVSGLTGGIVTGLPGLTNDANIQDYCLVQSGSNGNAYDVLYTISATSNTIGTVAKFSLVGGIWTANGTYTTTFGGFGLTAEPNAGGATLYLTTGQGAQAANSVVKVADAAGFNTTINITTATNTVLYTAAAGTVAKGIAFAPATITPSLTATPASIAGLFIAPVGSTSISDSITVAGTNLNSNVTVTAPASFQVATTLAGTYSASVTLTAVAGTLSATKVYVRFAPTAAGSFTGNIAVTATGATTRNVTVNGIAPALTTSVGAIAATFISPVGVPSISDSFSVSGANLTGSVTVTAPASFQVASTLTGTYGSSISIVPVAGVVNAVKVYVRFLPSATGTVSSNVTVTAANAAPANVAVTGATPGPLVLASLAAIANTFITPVGIPSGSDSFNVSGSNLNGNITVTAPTSFQVATTLNGTYGSSVVYSPVAGTVPPTAVYVRFLPSLAGPANGNVVISATGATAQNVAVTGNTPAPSVTTSLDTLATAFLTPVNVPSYADSFSITGANLAGNVGVTAPSGFQVATTIGGTFSSSVTFSPTGNALAATKVYVRFFPNTSGTATGVVTVSTIGGTSRSVAVTGATIAPATTVSATSISNAFTAAVNGTSGTDTFTVSAVALTTPLVIAAPAPFEVSTSGTTGFGNSVSLAPTAGTVPATIIYVRFRPQAAGSFTDTLTVSTTGVAIKNVLVAGYTTNATNPPAFNLATGNYLLSSWDSASAAGTYPANMIFHTASSATPALTMASLLNNWTCAYNLTSRPRVRGLAGDGFSMINTGNAQFDDCASGPTTKNTYMGAALLAVNTTGATGITLKYNAGLVKQSDGAIPRVYNLRLQYRLDSVSAFADMAPVSEYTSAAKTDGDLQTFTIALPAVFENKPYVMFRWLYYADASVAGASGTRPELRLDEIGVNAASTGIRQTGKGNTNIIAYPNPVATGGTLHFSEAISGKLYDVYGRLVTAFTGVKELSTGSLPSGIYNIITASGGHCRITIQ